MKHKTKLVPKAN